MNDSETNSEVGDQAVHDGCAIKAAVFEIESKFAQTVDAESYGILPAQRKWTVEQVHARYLLATRATGEGLWDWDPRHESTYYSAQWQSILGLPEEELTDTERHFLHFLHSSDRSRFLDLCRGPDGVNGGQFESEFRMLHADGAWRWILVRAIRIQEAAGAAVPRVVGVISDVTRHRVFDALTGLHNRFSLVDRLERRLENAGGDANLFALLFTDLDGFKRINDNFNHWHGDSVLVEIARRIACTVDGHPMNVAARIGGDEFVIMLDHVTEAEVFTYAKVLLKLLQQPVLCGGQQLFLTASVGIAMSTNGYTLAEDMLQDADMAMYRAKAAGKNQSCFFTNSMKEKIRRQMQVEVELPRALKQGELELHYQPKVLLKSGAITGFEALVRWNHPVRGLLGPGDFIPAAEQSDLILAIGRWTMLEAIRQAAAWRNAGVLPAHATMAVNVSARQFADSGLVEAVSVALAAEGLPPRCLDIEVTESALIDDTDSALATLRRLKALGVNLELDDFGMGYSSLSYLHRFPFDTLKVDRSFVTGLGKEEESSAIARTIIALGAALKMRVLAEGIETEEQTDLLLAMGCQYGQGYYFSRPLTSVECVRLLHRHEQARTMQADGRLCAPALEAHLAGPLQPLASEFSATGLPI